MSRIMRILVAEDDRDFIDLIKSSFLQTGDQSHVEAVSSGNDCLKKLRGISLTFCVVR